MTKAKFATNDDNDATLLSLAEAMTVCPCSLIGGPRTQICRECFNWEYTCQIVEEETSHAQTCVVKWCKGTGEVPLFPDLQKGCARCHGNGYVYSFAGPTVECGSCNGRTWVVADVDVGALMDMAREAGFSTAMWVYGTVNGLQKAGDVEVFGPESSIDEHVFIEQNTSMFDALAEALGLAVQARQEVT